MVVLFHFKLHFILYTVLVLLVCGTKMHVKNETAVVFGLDSDLSIGT